MRSDTSSPHRAMWPVTSSDSAASSIRLACATSSCHTVNASARVAPRAS
jgi:hypothetical protein